MSPANGSHRFRRIRLIRKEDMTSEQLKVLDDRLCFSESIEGECGPVRAWRAYRRYLYAFFDLASGKPIAIAEASGRPVSTPGWWIDPDFRNMGYGGELIDQLADCLRASSYPILKSPPSGQTMAST